MWSEHKDRTDEEIVEGFRMWWNDRYYMNGPSPFVFSVLRNYIRNMRTRRRWKKSYARTTEVQHNN